MWACVAEELEGKSGSYLQVRVPQVSELAALLEQNSKAGLLQDCQIAAPRSDGKAEDMQLAGEVWRVTEAQLERASTQSLAAA